MLKFLIGVLTGIVFAVVLVVISVTAIALSVGRKGEKPVVVSDNSVLVLRLDGDIPERPPVDYSSIPFLQSKVPVTVENVWSSLRKAAVDPHIRAVLLEPGGPSIGWGKMQEIKADLDQFKKSGKPIYAYLKAPNLRDYYLASGANKIYIEPESLLDLKGMRFELMYFKRTLDKLGVVVDVEHAGKYKDFGDMFTRSNASPETKEVLNSVIDGLYGNLVDVIATGRGKSAGQIRETIDNGPFLSVEAASSGLVDGVKFEDEIVPELKSALNGAELKRVQVKDYVRAAPPASMVGKQRIALVVGEGDISRGDPDSNSDNGIESVGFNKLLRQVQDDSTIKGVIVRVNSPGGEVTASDEIWRAMNLLSKKKPVVISMSDDAASGGYYMVMSGDPIVAYPGTLTGSIGVVFGKPNLHGLYDKLGVDKELIARGRFADIDSDYQSLSPEGRAKLREGIDADYRAFVTKVADSRKRPFNEIEPLAQGRVWLGQQAKQNGLVDELGGLDRAVELVKQKAKIAASERITLVTYPPKRTLYELLFSDRTDSLLDAAFLRTKLAVVPGLKQSWKDAHVSPWLHGGMMALRPFSIQIH
jgi:protease IV